MTGKEDIQGFKNSITFMSFNLRFGLADDGANSWENRQRAYPPLFKTVAPDFIGFQEANRFQGVFLDNLLEKHAYIGMRDPSPEFWQDNLIFYKKNWTCLKYEQFFLSDTPTRESKLAESEWPRQCTIGLFEKKRKKVIHVNTHFDFKASVQLRSAELLIEFLSDLPQTVPVVITGDFNTGPHSPAYNVFIDQGFQDVFAGDHSSTFHGFTGNDLGGHIDWILYRGNIKLKERMILRKAFSGIYPSDHYPVMAEFELEVPQDHSE